MRHATRPAALFFCLVILAISPELLYLGGCTTSQKAVAYKTLEAVAHTVDAAMTAYADAVVAGKVDAATQTKVRDLKSRYEKAFIIAATAAQANLQAPAPGDLATIAAALVELASGRTSK